MKRTLKILSTLLITLMTLSAFSQDGDFGKTLKPVEDCSSKYGVGQDSIDCVTSISLYRESYKNWKRSNNTQYMVDAFQYWRNTMFGCPCSSKNIYIDGEKMLTTIIKKFNDPLIKENWYNIEGLSVEEIQSRWIDTLVLLYDRRIEAFGQPYYVDGRRGVSLMEYAPDRYEQAFTALQNSFNNRLKKSSARTNFEYFKATVLMVENGKIDTTDLLEIYDAVVTTTKFNATPGNGNPRTVGIYRLTLEEIEKAGNSYLTCDVLVPSYGSKFEENKDNVDFLRKVTKMLQDQGCTTNEVYRKAARRLYELSPDSSSAFEMARMEHGLGNYSSSVKYLKDAASAYTSASSLENVYLLMADAYSKLNSYGEARNAANKVISLNPNNGRAYIIIGDLYANSAKSCMYKELITSYWVAYDTYSKAKSVDPTVADLASNKMVNMKARFPAKSQIFFHSLTVGNSFTVGCWINKSTIVRSSD